LIIYEGKKPVGDYVYVKKITEEGFSKLVIEFHNAADMQEFQEKYIDKFMPKGEGKNE
jgi:hypothetical protein